MWNVEILDLVEKFPDGDACVSKVFHVNLPM